MIDEVHQRALAELENKADGGWIHAHALHAHHVLVLQMRQEARLSVKVGDDFRGQVNAKDHLDRHRLLFIHASEHTRRGSCSKNNVTVLGGGVRVQIALQREEGKVDHLDAAAAHPEAAVIDLLCNGTGGSDAELEAQEWSLDTVAAAALQVHTGRRTAHGGADPVVAIAQERRVDDVRRERGQQAARRQLVHAIANVVAVVAHHGRKTRENTGTGMRMGKWVVGQKRHHTVVKSEYKQAGLVFRPHFGRQDAPINAMADICLNKRQDKIKA